MIAHLWAHDEMPPEYLELILCRDVYHCLPSQLNDEPIENILLHLNMMNAESYIRKRESQSRNG